MDDQNARVPERESKDASDSRKPEFLARLAHIVSNPKPLVLEPLSQNAPRIRLDEFYDLSRPGVALAMGEGDETRQMVSRTALDHPSVRSATNTPCPQPRTVGRSDWKRHC